MHNADCLRNYKLVERNIAFGSSSSMDLFRYDVTKSDGARFVVIKSLSARDLNKMECPVYKKSGLDGVYSKEWQMKRELEILEKLRNVSNHIVTVIDMFSSQTDMIHIVYAYAGKTVMKFAEEYGCYSACIDGSIEDGCVGVCSVDDTIESLKQLLSALIHVHDIDVCHKDIKPENVLLMSPFSRWHKRAIPGTVGELRSTPNIETPIHITLCDFNISEYMDSDKAIYDAQGTLHFTPPECFARTFQDNPNAGINGMARDIWSAGILGYVMLCGSLPVTGNLALEIQLKLIQLAMPENDQVTVSFPDWTCRSDNTNMELVNIIQKMLSINPIERPSAKAALDLIERLPPTRD